MGPRPLYGLQLKGEKLRVPQGVVEPRENLADGRQRPPISGAELSRHGRVLLALCRRLWRQRLFEDRRAEGHPPGDHVQDRRVCLQRPGIHRPHRVPSLHRDVSSFVVEIEELALRFDFRDEPVETREHRLFV